MYNPFSLKKRKKMENLKKNWLNPKEVQEEYGFNVSTLAQWRMRNKHLAYSKIGRKIRYKRADIEAFLNDNVVCVEGD
jgi:hypothetical protein